MINTPRLNVQSEYARQFGYFWMFLSGNLLVRSVAECSRAPFQCRRRNVYRAHCAKSSGKCLVVRARIG